MIIPESIRLDAEKALKAIQNRDWSLHAHISRRYPFGSEERRQFEQAKMDLAAEDREANPPDYFK